VRLKNWRRTQIRIDNPNITNAFVASGTATFKDNIVVSGTLFGNASGLNNISTQKTIILKAIADDTALSTFIPQIIFCN